METWNKTCTDCNWDSVCTHKKVLWDGKEYQYVTACCRAMTGQTFIPSTLPDEPRDWYLWSQFTIQKLVIYGRNQFIIDTDMVLPMCSTPSSSPRVTKIRDNTKDISQRNTIPRPLLGLKSVYENKDNESQGSLF